MSHVSRKNHREGRKDTWENQRKTHDKEELKKQSKRDKGKLHAPMLHLLVGLSFSSYFPVTRKKKNAHYGRGSRATKKKRKKGTSNRSKRKRREERPSVHNKISSTAALSGTYIAELEILDPEKDKHCRPAARWRFAFGISLPEGQKARRRGVVLHGERKAGHKSKHQQRKYGELYPRSRSEKGHLLDCLKTGDKRTCKKEGGTEKRGKGVRKKEDLQLSFRRSPCRTNSSTGQ